MMIRISILLKIASETPAEFQDRKSGQDYFPPHFEMNPELRSQFSARVGQWVTGFSVGRIP
jgi:hypothetical protein